MPRMPGSGWKWWSLLGRYWASFSFVGLAVATIFFALSLTPSLLPRHFAAEGVLAGIAGMPAEMAEAIVELMDPSRPDAHPLTTTVKDLTGKDARTFEQWARDHAALFN